MCRLFFIEKQYGRIVSGGVETLLPENGGTCMGIITHAFPVARSLSPFVGGMVRHDFQRSKTINEARPFAVCSLYLWRVVVCKHNL
jgi:hypothetical protein